MTKQETKRDELVEALRRMIAFSTDVTFVHAADTIRADAAKQIAEEFAKHDPPKSAQCRAGYRLDIGQPARCMLTEHNLPEGDDWHRGEGYTWSADSPNHIPDVQAKIGLKTTQDVYVERGHCNRCDRCGFLLRGDVAYGCVLGKCTNHPLAHRRTTCAGCGKPFAPEAKEPLTGALCEHNHPWDACELCPPGKPPRMHAKTTSAMSTEEVAQKSAETMGVSGTSFSPAGVPKGPAPTDGESDAERRAPSVVTAGETALFSVERFAEVMRAATASAHHDPSLPVPFMFVRMVAAYLEGRVRLAFRDPAPTPPVEEAKCAACAAKAKGVPYPFACTCAKAPEQSSKTAECVAAGESCQKCAPKAQLTPEQLVENAVICIVCKLPLSMGIATMDGWRHNTCLLPAPEGPTAAQPILPIEEAKCTCEERGRYRTHFSDCPWLLAKQKAAPEQPVEEVKCDVCDGHGFYMVNAHGPQEYSCYACSGTGVHKSKPAPEQTAPEGPPRVTLYVDDRTTVYLSPFGQRRPIDYVPASKLEAVTIELAMVRAGLGEVAFELTRLTDESTEHRDRIAELEAALNDAAKVSNEFAARAKEAELALAALADEVSYVSKGPAYRAALALIEKQRGK